MNAERFTVQWSPSHKLWLVYDRVTGCFVDHSQTRAGAQRMADRRQQEH